MAYGEVTSHAHAASAHHDGCMPDVTATRANGRLSLVLQRNNTDDMCWVGKWRLMVAYKARSLDAMVMPKIGELILPVSAGPVRGPRFSRFLVDPKARLALRNVNVAPAHRLDTRALSTNHNDKEACSVVVNIYARTRLRLELLAQTNLGLVGDGFKVQIGSNVLVGNIVSGRTFARLISPAHDIATLVSRVKPADIPKAAVLKGSKALQFDPARVLAALEKKDPKLANVRDHEVQVVTHQESELHVHVEKAEIPGVYHLGIYVEGTYCSEHSTPQSGHDHNHGEAKLSHDACGPDCRYENFSRILNVSVAVMEGKKP